MITKKVYIGLGSNIGNRENYLDRAIRSLIDDAPGSRSPILTNIRASAVYETNPISFINQPPFLNAVIEGETGLDPLELLQAVKIIEKDLGRIPTERWGPREIDIDILYIHNTIHSGECILPHPAAHERAFVLQPLSELAPDLIFQGQDKTVRELLSSMSSQGVRKAFRQWGTHPIDDTRNLIPVIEGKGNGSIPDITPSIIHIACDALCDIGILRIDSGVPIPLIEHFLKQSVDAFAISDEVKQKSLRGNRNSGYTPPNIEGVRGHGPDPLRHFLDVHCEHGFKPEPELESFFSTAHIVHLLLRDLAHDVFQIFDHEFRTWIARGTQKGPHALRVSQYLNSEPSPWKILFPSHIDFGLLTAYIGGTSAGLQVKIHGSWHDVYNPIGSIIFGVGSTLRMYVPERLKPIRHRVVGSTVGRISAVYFTELQSDIILPNGKTSEEHLKSMVKSIRQST